MRVRGFFVLFVFVASTSGCIQSVSSTDLTLVSSSLSTPPAPTPTPGKVYFNATFDKLYNGSILGGVGNFTDFAGYHADLHIARDVNIFRTGTGSAKIMCDDTDVDPKGDASARDELANAVDMNGLAHFNNLSSGTRFYAVSYRLSKPWYQVIPDPMPGSDSHLHNTILQMKKASGGITTVGTSPAFDIEAIEQFRAHVRGGSAAFRGFKEYECKLANSALNPGRWVDFVIKIKFDYLEGGRVVIWRRDQGATGAYTSFQRVLDLNNVANLFYVVDAPSGNAVIIDNYWKQGIYRTPNQTGWPNSQDPNELAAKSNTLWTDGLTEADTFKQAIDNAFQENYQGTIEPEADMDLNNLCFLCTKDRPC